MRWAVVLGVGVLVACKPGEVAKPVPSPTPQGETVGETLTLTEEDMELYLAVKRKALSRLEEALDQLQARGGDPVRELAELAAAEREAARALGADPARFARIGEAVAKLLALKGRAEETARLEQELRRNLQEITRLAETTRDPAAREFMDAQAAALREELAKLAKEQQHLLVEDDKLGLLERYRVEMAQLQARQEKLARRIREAMAAARANPLPH